MKKTLLFALSLFVCAGITTAQDGDTANIYHLYKYDLQPFIIIDGDDKDAAWNEYAPEWETIETPITFEDDSSNVTAPDLFGKIKLLYDEEFLYFIIKVEDQSINGYDGVFTGGSHVFDGIELMIDLEKPFDKGYKELKDDASQKQFRFNLDEDRIMHPEPRALREEEGFLLDPIYQDYDFNFQKNPEGLNGYVFEAMVDWRLLKAGYTPDKMNVLAQPGDTIRLEFMINDNDGATNDAGNPLREGQIAWRGPAMYGLNFLDASEWPDIVLVDELYSGTSVKKLHNSQFMVYPSVATDQLTISTGTMSFDRVKVTNILGVDVLTESSTNQTRLDLQVSGLTHGIYIVNIFEGNQLVAVKRFIKK